MKKYMLSEKLLILALLLTTFASFSQADQPRYTIGLANVSGTASTLEMDVTITVDNPQKITRLSQLSVGINYDEWILNNAAPCTSKNCGSWVYVGGKSPAMKGLATTINTVKAEYGHLRIVGLPLGYNAAIALENGTYTLGRYRFTNTMPWAANADARLWIQPSNEGNKTNTIVSTFPIEGSRKMVAYSASSLKDSNVMTLKHTNENPLHFVLNAKGVTQNGLSAVASPNPFTGSFQLTIQSPLQDEVKIKVYDMIGKQIESRTLTLSEIENTHIGEAYPSGIYTISVLQGNESQTIRIIKR